MRSPDNEVLVIADVDSLDQLAINQQVHSSTSSLVGIHIEVALEQVTIGQEVSGGAVSGALVRGDDGCLTLIVQRVSITDIGKEALVSVHSPDGVGIALAAGNIAFCRQSTVSILDLIETDRTGTISILDRISVLDVSRPAIVVNAAVAIDFVNLVTLDIVNTKGNGSQAQSHNQAQNQSNNFLHVLFPPKNYFVKDVFRFYGCQYTINFAAVKAFAGFVSKV